MLLQNNNIGFIEIIQGVQKVWIGIDHFCLDDTTKLKFWNYTTEIKGYSLTP